MIKGLSGFSKADQEYDELRRPSDWGCVSTFASSFMKFTSPLTPQPWALHFLPHFSSSAVLMGVEVRETDSGERNSDHGTVMKCLQQFHSSGGF